MLELIEHRGPLPWALALALLLALLALLVTLSRHRWPVRVFPAYIAAVVAPYAISYLTPGKLLHDGPWIIWIALAHVLVAAEAAWVILTPLERPVAAAIMALVASLALLGLWLAGGGRLAEIDALALRLQQYGVMQAGLVIAVVVAVFPALYVCIVEHCWDWRTYHGLLLAAWFGGSIVVNAEYRWMAGLMDAEPLRFAYGVEHGWHAALAVGWIVLFRTKRKRSAQSAPGSPEYPATGRPDSPAAP